MKRKLVTMLLLAALTLSMFGTAFAAKKSDEEELYARVNAANAKIESYLEKAQRTPHNDIEWLLNKIEVTVRPVFRYAEKIGATIVCDYRTVYVDGQYVDIDPLRVVNVGGD